MLVALCALRAEQGTFPQIPHGLTTNPQTPIPSTYGRTL